MNRRTLSVALQTGNLPDAALDFVKGTAAKPAPETINRGTEAPTVEESQLAADPLKRRLQPTDLDTAEAGLVSITVRVPRSVPPGLLLASVDRKLNRQRPWTQQEIVAEALTGWLRQHGYQRIRASGTRRWPQGHRSVLYKAGASCPGSTTNPPAGTGPQLRTDGANRVQGSTGSINARWRRELPGGDTEEPEADKLRGSAEKSRPRTAQRREGRQALASKRQQRRKPSRRKLDQGG